MNKLQYNLLALFVLVLLGVTSCKNKDLIKPTTTGGNPLGTSSLTITSNIGYAHKINNSNLTAPTNALSSRFVVVRNGIESRDTLISKTGTLISETPSNLLKLICLDNPKHSDINTTSVGVSGWKIESAHFLARNGATKNISSELSTVIGISLSYTICYFPDGFYKIFNHVDETLHQSGIFQLVIENNLAIGIIFQPQFIGIANVPFINHSSYNPNPFGYGIWGVTENDFFPIYSINPAANAILKMSKITF